MLIVLLGSGGIFRPYEEYYGMPIGPENVVNYPVPPTPEVGSDVGVGGPFMSPPSGRVGFFNPGRRGVVRVRDSLTPDLHVARSRRTGSGRIATGMRLRGALPELPAVFDEIVGESDTSSENTYLTAYS